MLAAWCMSARRWLEGCAGFRSSRRAFRRWGPPWWGVNEFKTTDNHRVERRCCLIYGRSHYKYTVLNGFTAVRFLLLIMSGSMCARIFRELTRDAPFTCSTSSKRWSLTTGLYFVRMYSIGLYRGVSFHIGTGNHTHRWYKPPRYGPHYSEVMCKIVRQLDKNGVVKEDNRLWVSLVVIAKKSHQ